MFAVFHVALVETSGSSDRMRQMGSYFLTLAEHLHDAHAHTHQKTKTEKPIQTL